jgi:hypothetical protein
MQQHPFSNHTSIDVHKNCIEYLVDDLGLDSFPLPRKGRQFMKLCINSGSMSKIPGPVLLLHIFSLG